MNNKEIALEILKLIINSKELSEAREHAFCDLYLKTLSKLEEFDKNQQEENIRTKHRIHDLINEKEMLKNNMRTLGAEMRQCINELEEELKINKEK